MRIAYSMYCLAAIGFFSAPAFSADKFFEIIETSGKVIVTTKDGSVPATLGQQLPLGTRVLVGNGAVARIASNDGICNASLPSNKVTVVNHKKLCAVQITPTSHTSGHVGFYPPAAGLAFFGIATGAAIWSFTQDDNNPVSTP